MCSSLYPFSLILSLDTCDSFITWQYSGTAECYNVLEVMRRVRGGEW